MSADTLGKHALEKTGAGHERDFDTKPYEYGDRFNLHIEKTLRNAVARTGGGTPVRLHPDDFEIERTEQLVRSSTVLMLDVSMSMAMRDNFLPAKKVTMALHSLISSQYPRDFLGMVSFSEVAREFNAATLPELSWDYVYGTNMQHSFQIARKMLAKQAGTKQIIMITDGEPTAHITPSGQPYFNYPPSQETVDLTLAEVAKCTGGHSDQHVRSRCHPLSPAFRGADLQNERRESVSPRRMGTSGLCLDGLCRPQAKPCAGPLTLNAE